MPMRVAPYARHPTLPTKTGGTFVLVLALHVGMLLLMHAVWQRQVNPASLREVVTAALLPAMQAAPSPPQTPEPVVPQPVAPQPVTSRPPPQAAVQPPTERVLEQMKNMPAPQANAEKASKPDHLADQSVQGLQATPLEKIAHSAPVAAAPAAAPTLARAAPVVPPSRVDASCEKPRYPPASVRLREEGVVGVRLLIDENGRVVSGSVEKSSGYKRLDDAALAGLSLCKFKPATLNGKPFQDWSSLNYRWHIDE